MSGLSHNLSIQVQKSKTQHGPLRYLISNDIHPHLRYSLALGIVRDMEVEVVVHQDNQRPAANYLAEGLVDNFQEEGLADSLREDLAGSLGHSYLGIDRGHRKEVRSGMEAEIHRNSRAVLEASQTMVALDRIRSFAGSWMAVVHFDSLHILHRDSGNRPVTLVSHNRPHLVRCVGSQSLAKEGLVSETVVMKCMKV